MSTPWDELSDYITRRLETASTPGVACGVLIDGDVVLGGFGVTSVDHPQPVDPHTLFQIGSITKTLTATAIMRLVEAGCLQLADRVREHVPEFAVRDTEAAAAVTVEHLLTHTSGWFGDHFVDTGEGDNALERYVLGMTDLEQQFAPGELFAYNNAAFGVAGMVIENATGRPFEAAMSELLLEPLGLRQSYFNPADVMTLKYVVGHDQGEVAVPWALQRALRPAGGVITSVADLLTYARFHLDRGVASDGARLLTVDSMDEMHAPRVRIWDGENCGLSWSITDVHALATLSHRGGTNGQTCELTLVPARGFGVAVLTNGDEASLHSDITERALMIFLNVQRRAPVPTDVPEWDVATCAGRYANPMQEFEVRMSRGAVVGQLTPKRGFPKLDSPVPPAPPPVSLAPCGPDTLLVLDGASRGQTIHVGPSEGGKAQWIRRARRILSRVA